MKQDEATLLGDFARWLIEVAAATRETGPTGELHRLFCEKLLALGIPLWRSSLGLELLHPEIGGAQIRWTAHEITVETSPRNANRSDYDNSPAQIVDETSRPYRRKLDGPVTDMQLLEGLRRAGASDYYIVPLPFLDRQRSAHISFATQRPQGFDDREIALLTDAALLFGPYAERRVLKRIALDLLATYVGRRSAAKVYDGDIDRGEAEMITATILIADMRGFTHYSDTHPIADVLSTLNDFFDILVAAIEAHDGEILKFIGDALLAIFPAGEGEALPSAPAIAAALEAKRRIAELNGDRARAGRTLLKFGLALDAGEIAYGNIGSKGRLDFTAIGPAINHAARLLEVAKRTNRDIVVSESFARGARDFRFESLGAHALRGIDGDQRVFGIPDGRS
ncbi:MAG: adenylate/guanylate cyclase domain-containing protein [Parvibaculaceae bacterium]